MKKSPKNKYETANEYSLYMMKNYIRDLGSQNGIQRQYARLAMVDIGEPAIDILVVLAMHPQWTIRWEAVNALSLMRNAVTAPVLINALEDTNESIRWVAAHGLITLGKPGLISLLEALSSYKLSAILRKNAHYILEEISKRHPIPGVKLLLQCLKDSDDYFAIANIAKNVLSEQIHVDYDEYQSPPNQN